MHRLLFLIFLAICTLSGNATHLIGGEIIWKCVGNGKYQFTVRLYRECGVYANGNDPAPLPTSVTLATNAPVSIVCPLQTSQDISPPCYSSNASISCGVSNIAEGAMQVGIYESAQITLMGSPPAGGWYFQWSSCCRPSFIANINTSGFMERAIMYPYINPATGNPLNSNPCLDNSPDFLNEPKLVACAGYPQSFNSYGIDADNDSLHYTWASAMNNSPSFPGQLAAYSNGYSFDSPLPGTTQNSANLPAVLDSMTGMLKFLSHTTGSFATVLKVESWRYGQLIGEIYRDIPIVVRNCQPGSGPCGSTANSIPLISIEQDTSKGSAVLPIDTVKNGQGITLHYKMTANIGAEIEFILTATDSDTLENCNLQEISLEAFGGKLSSVANYGDTNICPLSGPCATLHSMNGNPPGSIGFSNTLINQSRFYWKPDCGNINYPAFIESTTGIPFTFYFDFNDNACPVNGSNNLSLVISLKSAVPGPPDLSQSAINLDTNGHILFNWIPPPDTGNAFHYYVVYRSSGGVFHSIDTIYDWNVTQFKDLSPAPQLNAYFLRTVGGCSLMSESSDTVSVEIPIGIFEPLKKRSVTVYPNPFYHSLTVHSREELTCRLISQNGVVIWEGPVPNGRMDVSNLTPGAYFLMCYDLNAVPAAKIRLVKSE